MMRRILWYTARGAEQRVVTLHIYTRLRTTCSYIVMLIILQCNAMHCDVQSLATVMTGLWGFEKM